METTEQDPASILRGFARYQQVRGFSDRTINRRTWSLGLLATFLDPCGFDTLTPDQLEEFLMRWPAPQTRYSIHSDVRMLYRWALRRGLVTIDPTVNVDAPRIPKRAATPIRPEDVLRAIRTADGDLRLMIMLGAYAGLRVSEIAVLHGRDIHLDEGLLVVRGGKGGKDGTVPIAAELAAALRDASSGRLFPGVSGPAVSNRIRRHFRSLAIDARPHDLRHSYATQSARRAKGNLVLVARLMRHDSITNTQRYCAWIPDAVGTVTGLYEPQQEG